MYIRYLQVFRKLEDCYHQLLQPQKRAEVRLILDACIGRMLELKFQIVRHCGEYINYDDALVDLKLTPDVLEIPIPRCASPPPMVALLKCTIPPNCWSASEFFWGHGDLGLPTDTSWRSGRGSWRSDQSC